MFTKEDYEKYFDQIARVERKMIYRAYELDREIDEAPLKRILQRVQNDEVRHYGYIMKMLKAAGSGPVTEHRREEREYFIGVVRLQRPGGKTGEVKAYCVNLSQAGICVECSYDLTPGTVWDLEITLFEKEGTISRCGKVVWSKEVETDFFIAGFRFIPDAA